MATTTAAQSNFVRPIAERRFPPAERILHEGRELRCFAEKDWGRIGHIVVDYRALLRWAGRIELELKTTKKLLANIQSRADEEHIGFQAMKDANALLQVQLSSRDEAAKSAKRFKRWSTIGHVLQFGIIVALGATVAIKE